jgi:hypothetical protein
MNRLPSFLSALQPWVSLGLLNKPVSIALCLSSSLSTASSLLFSSLLQCQIWLPSFFRHHLFHLFLILPRLIAGFRNKLFLRCGVVNPTPNLQPGGPGYPFSSGSSPLTCLAWEALPVGYATASSALWFIWPRKPLHVKVVIPWGGGMMFVGIHYLATCSTNLEHLLAFIKMKNILIISSFYVKYLNMQNLQHYLVIFVLFGCYLCCSVYCLCVNVYCHRVTTQLHLINTSYYYVTINCNGMWHGVPQKWYKSLAQLMGLYICNFNFV